MNLKNVLSILFFFFSISYITGERIIYYKNPRESLPIVITRNADLDYYDYTYYILNKYKNPVFASKENPEEAKKDDVRERFFTSVEDYRKPKRIRVEWDYRDDKESEHADVLKDGMYELHITETNKFQRGITRDYVYYIVLDTVAPYVKARLSQNEIQKNNKEFFSLDINKESKARSWRVFVDDELKYEEDYPYGEEKHFTTRHFYYNDYAHLPYGKHSITIIAKDSALNRTEMQLDFELVKDPFKFLVFSNKEILFRKDGNVIPLYYTAIGNVSSEYWSCAIRDDNGVLHYSDNIRQEKKGYCNGFRWDGISQVTNQRVPVGSYTVSISCSDSLGATYTQIGNFVVSEDLNENITPYISEEPDEEPLRAVFRDGAFHFEMKYYKGAIEGAKLNIKKGDDVVFECDVENAKDIVWNGCNNEGVPVISTSDEYLASVVFEDEENTELSVNIKAPLILEESENNRKRVIIDSIYFPGYEVDVLKADQYFTSNGQSFKKLAEALQKTLKKDDVLVIVGNANYTTYPDKTKMFYEDSLLEEISLKRAQMVKLIFMFYGISEKQIRVEANGGQASVVTPNDKDNWKNRRVDFFIEENN